MFNHVYKILPATEHVYIIRRNIGIKVKEYKNEDKSYMLQIPVPYTHTYIYRSHIHIHAFTGPIYTYVHLQDRKLVAIVFTDAPVHLV